MELKPWVILGTVDLEKVVDEVRSVEHACAWHVLPQVWFCDLDLIWIWVAGE